MWGTVLPENPPPPETLPEALLEVLLETRELSLEGGCMETSRLEEAWGGHRRATQFPFWIHSRAVARSSDSDTAELSSDGVQATRKNILRRRRMGLSVSPSRKPGAHGGSYDPE